VAIRLPTLCWPCFGFQARHARASQQLRQIPVLGGLCDDDTISGKKGPQLLVVLLMVLLPLLHRKQFSSVSFFVA